MTDAEALLQAVKAKDAAAVERLLAEDATLVDARDASGATALLTSIYHGAADVTAVLARYGARWRPWEAAAAGRTEALEAALAAAPQDVDAHSEDGWTALHLAAFFGRAAAVDALLAAGADPLVASRNREANLPINAAAAGRHLAVVRRLVEAGCPADARGSDAGYTALHLAAHAGDTALVRCLLDAGADPMLHAGDGRTAFDLARQQGHAAVVELLGADRQ